MAMMLNQQLNSLLQSIDVSKKPNLFLHVCCAPCSTSVISRLHDYFNIYIIYYNPNIDTEDEYNKRLGELKKLISKFDDKLVLIAEKYDHNEFLSSITGLENEKEGGKRCEACFNIRLKHTYKVAKEYIDNNNLQNDTNYLCTTLSVSPHKNAELIYKIGSDICDNTGICYLPSDFKKEDGYLNSIKLSKLYDLYRQNYCGCEFSKTN